MPRHSPFLLFLLTLLPTPSAGQAIADTEFRINYSSAGITGLKHVNDSYDTDYISPARTLGDLFIRFRKATEKDWAQADAADSLPSDQSQQTIRFSVGHLLPTLATSAKASASVGSPTISALNDRVLPANSHDDGVFHFAWHERNGPTEWVQYEFPSAVNVSSVQVYWAVQDHENLPCKLPKSWRVLYRNGDSWNEVASPSGYPLNLDGESEAKFAPVATSALRIEAHLQDGATAGLYEWRVNNEARRVAALQDLDVRESFHLDGKDLLWTISLKNRSAQSIEVGDLALPLQFNTNYVWDKTETYTKRLIPHSLVAGNGSFLYWMRTNAEGPYLVMTPGPGSGLEYFEPRGFGRGVSYFIHSKAAGEELRAKGGTWRLPNTNLILNKSGLSADSVEYQFRFRWAQDYAAVRQVLYDQGGFDLNFIPGMTVPTDLPATFSLRTHNKDLLLVPEFPAQTKIEFLGERANDTFIYRIHFAKLGENLLKVQYGKNRYLSLEFFVTEALETLFKKRAAFLVSHEQIKDSSNWYNSVFSQWDMKNQALRSPNDLDGLSYAIASDDPALGKAPYIAGKNIAYPNQQEIDAVENYLRNFVWGGLQQTDKEPYPYAIYGIPNWRVNRDSPKDDPSGKKRLWRIYDYPHIILLYYNMYEVAKLYPSMTKYLDRDGYLDRAFGTAKAFFTVPMEIVKWSPYETGTYNELVIPELIDALYENGRKQQAEWLRSEWERKVKHFVKDHPYLFGSEYPFDSTGFESTHAFAKYAMNHALKSGESSPERAAANDFGRAVKYEDAAAFLEEQMRLNLACRGWLEGAYYYLGSDYRGSGPSSYTLSYMAQMGGWAILDYALYYARDSYPYLRLGYASYLSSWGLLNSGTPESNYGYWFPGKENDGGAGGGFEPRPWGHAWLGNKEMGRGSWWYSGEIDLGFSGALRSAATIVADDPVFGLIAYGGDLRRQHGITSIIPRDGLRTRFHMIGGDQRLHVLLERDGFAKEKPIRFNDNLSQVDFALENRAGFAHQAAIRISGLPVGIYRVTCGGKSLSEFSEQGSKEIVLSIPIPDKVTSVSIVRIIESD